MNTEVISAKGIIACIAGGCGYLLGGWDVFLEVLATLVIIDYVTGVLAALKEGKFDYHKGLWGIVTKLGVFVVVVIAAKADIALTAKFTGFPMIRTAVLIPLIGNEGFSAIRNLSRLGVWVPKFFKDALRTAKEMKPNEK